MSRRWCLGAARDRSQPMQARHHRRSSRRDVARLADLACWPATKRLVAGQNARALEFSIMSTSTLVGPCRRHRTIRRLFGRFRIRWFARAERVLGGSIFDRLCSVETKLVAMGANRQRPTESAQPVGAGWDGSRKPRPVVGLIARECHLWRQNSSISLVR